MKRDLVDYAYLSDNLRYADLFNGVLFGGEEIIVAENLKGEDTKLAVVSDDGRKGRYRDVIRKYEGDMNYAVLGVENQEAVDYTMPFRIMEYEVGEYSRQIAGVKKDHQRLWDVTGKEYLCKFKKEDKIYPCITLVLFWGENWDGAKSIKEMMNLKDIPVAFRNYVNDYPMHLVNIRELEDTSVFKTDLKLVFDFMKHTKDRGGMRSLLLGNDDYRKVSRDAYEVMRAHTNLDELDKFIMDNTEEEGEVVDMCQAIREIIEEECELARAKAIKEGLEQGIAEGIEKGIEKGLEQGIAEGIEKGIEKGIAEGIEKGIEKGIAEGRAEGKKEGILLQIYRMVERGRLSVAEALEDLNYSKSESEFVEGMLAAGYRLP